MGWLEYGNFDGDEPRDYLADLVSVWERIIDHALAGRMKEAAAWFAPEMPPFSTEGQETVDTVVMPTIEVMIAVAEKLPCDYLPSAETVSKWTAEILRIYDQDGVEGWGPGDERRQAIVETLDRLAQRVAGREDAATDPDE